MTTTEKDSTTLTGSQDLLTYFNLIPIYNKVVKPFPPPDRASGLDPSLYPYISDLPGRMDMGPDGYLMNLLRDPQAIETGPSIKPLDADTLRDAFSLKEGPIPGFDASILGTDDGGNNTMMNPSYYPGEDRTNYNSLAEDVDQNGERKHKKKKKKRKHGHDDEEGHHGDHRKKKKKRKDKERREETIGSL